MRPNKSLPGVFYGTWAAKSRRAALVLMPLLDILQSVPILGFISVTVVFFMALGPGRVLGAEFAAVFAIFTSQAWNMSFSFYQSLRMVPVELVEAARGFQFFAWMRFWRLDVPFAMPALIWNKMETRGPLDEPPLQRGRVAQLVCLVFV